MQPRRESSAHVANNAEASIAALDHAPPSAGLDQPLIDWDFNDLIWHDTSALDPSTTNWLTGETSVGLDPALVTIDSFHTPGGVPRPGTATGATFRPAGQTASTHSLAQLPEVPSPASSVDNGSHALVEHFLASDVPPILASVEVGPRWSSTKMLFASLARASTMVRNAMTAFSALQLEAQTPGMQSEFRNLYEKSCVQLTGYTVSADSISGKGGNDLASALAAAFFLGYSDLLTNRSTNANAVLKKAADLVKTASSRDFTLNEKRLVSWIRLVDARASSAGSEGAFLAATEGDAYSPQIHQRSSPGGDENAVSNLDADTEISEILFDVLYTPGLAFYQRVQSIMARVSNIDPWHRSRGTVRDETEVMALAATISADLRALEKQRPALMEHAVAGSLNERHLSKDIASAITRSYRTYWANYEAGFIHLHRVAHKHLPATSEVMRARSTIKRIVRLFEQTGESLPTNFIWPLLMACCEEDDFQDRSWMIAAIRSMQGAACNARPIADVLEEVHRRQDASKQRADVRQTSLDLFNMSFAVV